MSETPAKSPLGFLREPFVLFLLAGAAIFIANAVVAAIGKTEVVYSPAIEAQLVEDFEIVTGRKADADDREILRNNYIADALLFREAIDRGMHLTDPKTRTELTNKMRYLIVGAPSDPSEEDMIDYYASNLDRYRSEQGATFSQVYFVDKPANSDAVLADLNAGKTVAGDDFWLGRDFPEYDNSVIRGIFGQPFLDGLHAARIGTWYGPVSSERGWHFVRKDAEVEPRLIPYQEIREQVRRDIVADEAQSAIDAEVAKLREKYRVVEQD